MEWEDLARDLSAETASKIVLLVMDGVGGLPADGRSELEAARKPHLDALAKAGVCGVADPVMMGITPGSGPAGSPAGRIARGERNLINWEESHKERRSWNGKTWPGT